MSVSLDGFVCGINGEIDWLFKTMSADGASWTSKKISEAGAHLMGRKTFNDMADYWPNSSEVFAKPMNDIPKIVFSRNGFDPSKKGKSTRALQDAVQMNRADGENMLSELAPNAQTWSEAKVITESLTEAITKLKKEDGKTLVAHGGASFAQNLVETGLVDEFWLLRHPVAIGQGLALFGALKSPLFLNLTETHIFSSGALGQVYTSRS